MIFKQQIITSIVFQNNITNNNIHFQFFPESPTDVTAEIHAEMDSEPNILQSPCSEEAEQVPKPKPERSFAAEIDFDEIFAIEDEIPWKIVSKNVEFYRIGEKQVITHFSSGPEVGICAV